MPAHDTNTLPKEEATTPEFPTRCTDCQRPVHKWALFPRGRCIDCHAAVTPMPTAEEVVGMWKGGF